MTTTNNSKRVKCTGCGARTRRTDGLCAACAGKQAAPVATTPEAADANPTGPGKHMVAAATTRAKRLAATNGHGLKGAARLAKLDNPFRPSSAQYAYFEIMRDGKDHTYEELNKKPQARWPKDLVWFMLDHGRKNGGFRIIKERNTARMEVSK
jgi:hypothetical protein